MRGTAKNVRWVDRLDQVGEGHALADHRTAHPREGQSANEHIGRLTPRRLAQLKPIPLDLLPRLVDEVDRDAVAAGAARSHRGRSPSSRSSRTNVTYDRSTPSTSRKSTVHRRAHRRQTAPPSKRETAPGSSAPVPAKACPPRQILADRLAVAARVPGDRRHRPTARSQRVNLHVVLLSQHPPGAPVQIAGFDTATLDGAPDRPRARQPAPLGPHSASCPRYTIKRGEFP